MGTIEIYRLTKQTINQNKCEYSSFHWRLVSAILQIKKTFLVGEISHIRHYSCQQQQSRQAYGHHSQKI